MATTKILWSGLTGRTGREAIRIDRERTDVAIVMGASRRMTGPIEVDGEKFEGVKWRQYGDLCRDLLDYLGINAVVDFSNTEVFDEVLHLAIRTKKPLISGTSGLSDRQMASLYDATHRIPVFRGGNFRFKVKRFIDEAVKLAEREEGQLVLYENFYQGKSLPSETSKVLQRRISEATGRIVEVHSSDTFAKGNLICDWELQVSRDTSPTDIFRDKVHCRTIGFDELAHDVLEITKVMATKPVRAGKFYDLDEIWPDLMPAESAE